LLQELKVVFTAWNNMPPAQGGGAAASLNDDDDVINPDLLGVKFEGIVCVVCTGVMVEPTVGCPGLHSFCRACYVRMLKKKKECPMCRHPVSEHQLVLNRDLDGLISQQPMRCKHSKGEGGRVAKRAKQTPAASMTVEALKEGLRQRGLPTGGKKAELVARLEEDRGNDAGEECEWEGKVGELGAHRGECLWAPVKCPFKDCRESPLRRDRFEHEANCGIRVVSCEHCKKMMTSRRLAEHEGRCPHVKVECMNEGCSVKRSRGAMNVHREACKHEEVTCPCPGCDARLLRKGMDAHVTAMHLGLAVRIMQSAWHQNAVLQSKVAASESEQRLAAASATSWVFNWRAEGWGGGNFETETHDFGDGVAGKCILQCSSNPEHSHYIGYSIEGRDKCRLHATLSILDKHDKILRQVDKTGTAEAPNEKDFLASRYWGRSFTPTAAEKAQSVRADGSIRLRAEVRLFLD
jgi:hypothetical protein